jgi:hypothetical protein
VVVLAYDALRNAVYPCLQNRPVFHVKESLHKSATRAIFE